MNPRQDAYDRLDGRYEVRVLEPSPPAVDVGPWFADDPTDPGDVPSGRRLVSPVTGGDLLWSDLVAEDPALAAWCAERWLAAYPRLGMAPPALVTTRTALHRLAERVIAPARQAANGKFGLRFTRGGFGTPFFGDDVQVRVEGAELVVQGRGDTRRAPITTLRAAGELVGELLPATVRAQLDDDLLTVEPESACFLGQWYGFAASVLEELRAQTPAGAEPSRVQLWPEHFDLALELGREQAGARAAYGLSPGDEQHSEPYAYVAPWVAPAPGELWQASGFSGAELSYGELRGAADQRAAVLEFFRLRAEALSPPS
jgi:hypothetical protein